MQLKIRNLNGKSRIIKIDENFWSNLNCLLGFSEKFIIYRKKGRPTEAFHYSFMRDFTTYESYRKDRNSVEYNLEYLRLQLPVEQGYSQSYLDKDSGFSAFWEEAKRRDKLLMSYYEEGSFIEKDMHHLYLKHKLHII